jgi:WD40 repeat protein
VAFSPDGHHIASSGRDHIILLWTTGHYGQPSSLRGHTGAVSCVAFSQDGRYVISGSEDGYVKKWSAAGDSYFPQLIGHEDLIEQTAFSPDGRRLASASRDMTVRVWDAENGVQSLCLRGHQARVKAITFSNDGAKIASGGGNSIFEENDFSVRIWDQANGNELLRVSETADVEAIHFSPDDHRIAVATANGVSIWDASSGERVAHCGGGYALSVKYDSIGRRLIVPGGGITRILDATTGNELERAAGHKFEFEESKQIFRWQADSAAGDNPRLECTGTGQVVAWFPGTIRAVATNPAGTTWAVADMFHLRLVKLEGRSLDLG